MSHGLKQNLENFIARLITSTDQDCLTRDQIWNDTVEGRFVVGDYVFCESLGVNSDDAIHLEVLAELGWVPSELYNPTGPEIPVWVCSYRATSPREQPGSSSQELVTRARDILTRAEAGEIMALAFSTIGSAGSEQGWIFGGAEPNGTVGMLLIASVGILDYDLKASASNNCTKTEKDF